MDVILHIGAHRCASTTFQNYMRLNAGRLAHRGIGFWGPRRTRAGLFAAVIPVPGPARGRDLRRRATGRVQMHLARSAAQGCATLVVSDENMMGSVRGNLRIGELYCGVGERMARYHQAFGGRISDVVLNIRALDTYWASALGYGVMRGHALPGNAMLERLAGGARSWRDVITDVACAMPDARLWVLPFEIFAGRPEAQLGTLTGTEAPKSHARGWLNPTARLPELRAMVGPRRAQDLPDGDGRWQPLSAPQAGALRARYSDDLMWLAGGADGLAWLMDDPQKPMAVQNPPHDLSKTDRTRGRPYDHEERRMARGR
jgi:hypothetical protein